LPSTQLPRLQLTRPVCLAQPGQTHLRRATFASTVYTPSTTPHACTRSRPALARLLTLPSPLRPLPIVASRTPPQRTFGGPYLLTLEQGLLALEQGLLALVSWPWSPGPRAGSPGPCLLALVSWPLSANLEVGRGACPLVCTASLPLLAQPTHQRCCLCCRHLCRHLCRHRLSGTANCRAWCACCLARSLTWCEPSSCP